MKQILTILFVLVVVVVAVGFYQGWFNLTSSNTNQGNKSNINLEVDGDKMREDADAVSKKAGEISDRVTGGNDASDNK